MIKVLPLNFHSAISKTTALVSALSLVLLTSNGAYASSSVQLASNVTPVTTTAAVSLASFTPIQILGYRLKTASASEKKDKASSLAGLPFTASSLFNTGLSNFYNESYSRDFIQPKPSLTSKPIFGSSKVNLSGELSSNVMLGAYRQQANLYDLKFKLTTEKLKLGLGFTVSDYHYVIPTNPNLVSKNYNKGLVFLGQTSVPYDLDLTYQLSYQFFNNKVNRKYSLFDKTYSFNHDYNQHDLTNALFVSKNFAFNFILPDQVVTPFFGASYTASMLPLVTEDLGGYRLEVAKQTLDHYDLLTGLTYSYTNSNFNVVASYSFRYQLNDRKTLESKLTDDKTTIPLNFTNFDQRYEQVFSIKASYTYGIVSFGGQVTLMDYVDYESSYGVFVKVSY